MLSQIFRGLRTALRFIFGCRRSKPIIPEVQQESVDSMRHAVFAVLQEQCSQLLSLLNDERRRRDEERERLLDILFKYTGIVPSGERVGSTPGISVRTPHRTWQDVKDKLESTTRLERAEQAIKSVEEEINAMQTG